MESFAAKIKALSPQPLAALEAFITWTPETTAQYVQAIHKTGALQINTESKGADVLQCARALRRIGTHMVAHLLQPGAEAAANEIGTPTPRIQSVYANPHMQEDLLDIAMFSIYFTKGTPHINAACKAALPLLNKGSLLPGHSKTALGEFLLSFSKPTPHAAETLDACLAMCAADMPTAQINPRTPQLTSGLSADDAIYFLEHLLGKTEATEAFPRVAEASLAVLALEDFCDTEQAAYFADSFKSYIHACKSSELKAELQEQLETYLANQPNVTQAIAEDACDNAAENAELQALRAFNFESYAENLNEALNGL